MNSKVTSGNYRCPHHGVELLRDYNKSNNIAYREYVQDEQQLIFVIPQNTDRYTIMWYEINYSPANTGVTIWMRQIDHYDLNSCRMLSENIGNLASMSDIMEMRRRLKVL